MRPATIPDLAIAGFHLRPIERRDLADWYAYLSVPANVEHTSWNVQSPDDLLPMLDAYESTAPASSIRFAIAESASDRLIGTIGFHSVAPLFRHAELAYDLAQAYWGRGIGPAACRAVVRWAFQTQGYVRIHASVLDSNQASRRVLEKCGFSYEGTLRDFRFVRGEPRDFRHFSLLLCELVD